MSTSHAPMKCENPSAAEKENPASAPHQKTPGASPNKPGNSARGNPEPTVVMVFPTWSCEVSLAEFHRLMAQIHS